jgi:hypothetical protein
MKKVTRDCINFVFFFSILFLRKLLRNCWSLDIISSSSASLSIKIFFTSLNSLSMSILVSLTMSGSPWSQKHEHLLNGQMDNEVDIAAYWDRYGVQSFKPKPDKEKKFPLPPRFLQNYAPFQSESHISCQLQIHIIFN